MNVERLDHLVLTVKDIAATCEFYQRVMGMKKIVFGENREALLFGIQKINLHERDSNIALKAQHPLPGSADLCFITRTPITEVVEHLISCGVEILSEPSIRAGATGPILSVYFRDPDLNLIEVSNYIQGEN
jgi:catechol 2,3-dioxygenase-like lactoylglutathione lyase family enzyme